MHYASSTEFEGPSLTPQEDVSKHAMNCNGSSCGIGPHFEILQVVAKYILRFLFIFYAQYTLIHTIIEFNKTNEP